MSSPAITLLREYLPVVIMSAGTAATVFVGLSTWFGKNSLSQQDLRVERIIRHLSFLKDDLRKIVDTNASEHKMMHELLHGLRAEQRLASKDFAVAKSGLIALEKTVRAQQQTMYEHVKYVSRLEIRLEDLSKHPQPFPRSSNLDT
jgi:hypothetical protein